MPLDHDALIAQLLASFLDELDEGVGVLERSFLALERMTTPGPARDAVVEQLMRTAHSVKGAARSADVPEIERACHALEGILGAVRRGRALEPALLGLLLGAVDGLQDAARRLRSQHELAGGTLAALLPALAAAEQGPDAAAVVPAAPAAPLAAAAPDGGRLKVSAERADRLLALASELTAARTGLDARAGEFQELLEELRGWTEEWAPAVGLARRLGDHPAARLLLSGRDRLSRVERELARLAAALDTDRRALRLSAGPLEDEVRRLRMVPFARACEGLERAVRDVAAAGGKRAALVLEGTEVELDGAVLEPLRSPLLHLVRNAVDHGLEGPEARAAAGKPAEGTVTVGARLRGSQVMVSVQDDGAGLDFPAIRARAQAAGLEVPATDDDVARLIFRSGFSTARQVTAISGRGVGLDVVMRQLESVHGSASVSSLPGRGTTFVLAVPLTLGTLRTLLVEAGGQRLALAQTSIERLVRLDPADIHAVAGRQLVNLDGHPVAVATLASVLGLPEGEALRPGEKVPAVVVATGEHRSALVVDRVLGEGEVLAKGLGPRIRRLRHVMGVTQLADGQLVPILGAADLGSGAQHPRQADVRPRAAAEPARKQVLLVEDSVTTRALEQSILLAAGFDVLTAPDGAEGWRLLQERGADAVVSDVQMPRMDGLELTRTIRAAERFRHLPVVLVTGLATEEDRLQGLQAGANAYLVKSAFEQQALLDTLAQLL